MIPATTSDGFLLALESHMTRHGQGHHLAVTVLEMSGAPDLPAIGKAAASLGARHPILNSRLSRSFPSSEAAWQPGTPRPVPLHTHPTDNLDALIGRLLNSERIDIRRDGPNLELHLLPLDESRWALLILWPHALLDAIGLDKLISELDSSDTTVRHDCGDTFHGRSTWSASRAVVEEMRTFPAWRIRSLHEKHHRPGRSRFEVLRFTAEESARIHAANATYGGELLRLPYFASLSGRAVKNVIARRHPDEPTAILLSIPVQRVGDPAKRPLFQNHMTACSVLLTHEELTDLKSASRAFHRKYAMFLRRKLPAAMDSLMAMMRRCPSRFFLKPAAFHMKGEICSLFHSHTGRFAEKTTHLFGSPIKNGYHVPGVSAPPAIGIFFSERDGIVTCTLSWKEGNITPDEIDHLKRQLLIDLGLGPLEPAPG